MSNQTVTAPKVQSAYKALAAKYFIKCSVIRKHFTGNGSATTSHVAEAIIATATVRMPGSNRINMKASVAELNAVMLEIGLNTPKATLAEVI